jgi:hypothetical protein
MKGKKERPGFTNPLDEEFTDVPGQDLQEIRHRHGSLVSRDVEEGPTRDNVIASAASARHEEQNASSIDAG